MPVAGFRRAAVEMGLPGHRAGLLAARFWAQVSKEYQSKRRNLYHFVKFVEWPASRFATETDPIVIAFTTKSIWN